MAIKTIAIMSAGEMGAAVGRALHDAGFDVVTCLDGRGEFSRKRAEEGGFRLIDTIEAMLGEAELMLSILPPEFAPAQAERIAVAMKASGSTPPYVDCNAVSPDTSRAIGKVIEGAGAAYIDGGIVGSPPGKTDKPVRIFVSGAAAPMLDALDGKEIAIKQCGAEIGRGSAVKMVYAGITKGTSALHAAALLAAEKLGVADELHEELAYSAALQADGGADAQPARHRRALSGRDARDRGDHGSGRLDAGFPRWVAVDLRAAEQDPLRQRDPRDRRQVPHHAPDDRGRRRLRAGQASSGVAVPAASATRCAGQAGQSVAPKPGAGTVAPGRASSAARTAHSSPPGNAATSVTLPRASR
jgi:3-hydroxyisobutyrate dehydrogenase-like beta-hydroxyacid dehydrogenase